MTRQQAIYSYYLFLLLTSLLLYTKLYAQPGYETFLLQEDNKPLKINTLFKNDKGYLYTGTSNGLYKFDGDKFTRINFQNKDYNDTVTAIFQDDKKKMWLGFQSGRIANVINGILRYYNPEEGTPKKKITSFIQDAEHNIWYSSYGEGLYFIRNNHHYLFNADDGLSDVNISALMVAGKDILAATDQGINICSVKKGQKNVRIIGPRQGLPDYIVTSITTAGHNKFWIGLQDKGFCLYDHTSGLISMPIPPGAWTHGQVNTILEEHNNLWIATQDEGLFKFALPAGPLTAV
ncbi:MAG TPA: hypothetical protein VK498_03375, partial [Ferruginibacter sp.]|nr:hypothetical protein [Ferruginibacter sp.]